MLMTNVYIEAHPKDGGSVKYYVVEDQANRILATAATQAEAIAWANSRFHHPLIARVRRLGNDKKKPDHWRSEE
jgi:hypothetical protein